MVSWGQQPGKMAQNLTVTSELLVGGALELTRGFAGYGRNAESDTGQLTPADGEMKCVAIRLRFDTE